MVAGGYDDVRRPVGWYGRGPTGAGRALLVPDGVMSRSGVEEGEGECGEEQGGEHAGADDGEDPGVGQCPRHVAEEGQGVRGRQAEPDAHCSGDEHRCGGLEEHNLAELSEAEARRAEQGEGPPALGGIHPCPVGQAGPLNAAAALAT
jgi:hypothetical protein